MTLFISLVVVLALAADAVNIVLFLTRSAACFGWLVPFPIFHLICHRLLVIL